MTDGAPLTAFQRKIAEKRARESAQSAVVSGPVVDDDLIPEEQYEKSDADRQLDKAINDIDIVLAYRRWCGKMEPKISNGQTESIMISCPTPGHRDSNPSAWLNTDKQTWYCGSCQQGGDAHDIAAYHFGYPVPGYKNDSSFNKLRRQMAEDFGFKFVTLPGGVSYVEAPVYEDEEPAPAPVEVPVPVTEPTQTLTVAPEPQIEGTPVEDQLAEVIQMFDEDEEIVYPTLDWRAIVPEGTFLDKYMQATTIDDVTEEYHFWNGMIAVAFALGRRARLFDMVPVHGNLFVCSLGASGSGKSKALYHLDRLFDAALPHDWTDPESRGVRKMNAMASAEVLVHSFQKPILDLSSAAKKAPIVDYAPVSGLINFNELSALIGRANRQGNTLKPTLMQFYDMEKIISTSSMTTGVKEAHDPFACALTTTQPLALKTLLGRSDDDSGFLNRWIFVAGPEKKRFAIGGVLVDIMPAVEPLRAILRWSGRFADNEFVTWSDDAARIFTDFFHDTIEPAKRKAQSGLITRIDLLMKKIILLLSGNKMENEVTAETVKEAIACYDYLMACYAIPESQIGNSLYQEVSDAVIRVAQRQFERDGKGITLYQLGRSLARRKYPTDLLLKVADGLTKIGFLEMTTSSPGQVGRPTVRYRYVG